MLSMRHRPLAAVALIVALAAGWSSAFAAHRPGQAPRHEHDRIPGQRAPGARGRRTHLRLAAARRRSYGFVDLSPKHDGSITVTAQVPAHAGRRSAERRDQAEPGWALCSSSGLEGRTGRTRNRSLAFSVAGSKFRLVLDGTSVLNGAGGHRAGDARRDGNGRRQRSDPAGRVGICPPVTLPANVPPPQPPSHDHARRPRPPRHHHHARRDRSPAGRAHAGRSTTVSRDERADPHRRGRGEHRELRHAVPAEGRLHGRSRLDGPGGSRSRHAPAARR